ncbi:MAG: wax ester/triacylglycerol synthase domain-containing protein, partial [Nocardioidaceae bacterium]
MGTRAIEPVDTIWLNMDRDNNLMVIESVMMLESPPDWERFLDVLQRRVVEVYPVFSQRPVRAAGGLPFLPSRWEDDTDFSLARHVHRVTLPAPGGDEELQDYVTEHLSVRLPRDRPLWEMHLVDGYGEGAAVYSRLHHAMADGIALMQVLLSLTDATAEGAAHASPAARRHTSGLLGTAVHRAGATASVLFDAPRLLTTSHLGDAVKLAAKATGATTKLLFARNPDSALSGVATVSKRAIWAPPIPLADVVAVAHGTGTTVNDVLMSALAGAVSTYLAARHGQAVDIPTMVPVNLRPLDQPLPRELGNRFALVLFSLPSGLGTSFARLAETKRRMDAIKTSPEALLTMGMIYGVGHTGPELERLVVDFFANKATGVTTNVPGPSTSRYVAGTRISAMLGWAPESGNQALGTA